MNLEKEIRSYKRIALCLNASMCSNVLAAVAVKYLGAENILAVTVDTPFTPKGAQLRAANLASILGLRRVIVSRTFEEIPDDILHERKLRHLRYRSYIYECMKAAAKKEGFDTLVDATCIKRIDQNAFDWAESREARATYGIKSPFLNLGFDIEEIRDLGRKSGLYESFCQSSIDSCLITRFASGMPILREDLTKIQQVEDSYHSLGFPHCRLRLLALDTLVLEVPKNDFYALARLNPPFAIKAMDED